MACFLVLSCILSSAISQVQASEAAGQPEVISVDETGKLKVSCTYSSDIQPDEKDTFIISYALTGLTDVQTLEIDAASAAEGEIETDIPYGVYNVVDITYDGNNEEIEAQGYGADLIFQAVAGEEADVLQVAVGSEAGRDLEAQGNGILAKVRGYIVNSFDDQPMEGEVDSTEDTGNKEDATTSGQDNNDQHSKRDDEKQGETVYYDEEGDTQDSEVSPVKKIIPLIIMAGMVAVVIFILHKKGKI